MSATHTMDCIATGTGIRTLRPKRSPASHRRVLLGLAASWVAAGAARPALATTFTFTHADVSNNWSVAANWISSDPNVPPPPPLVPAAGDTTDLVFGGLDYGAGTTSTQNIGDIVVDSITFLPFTSNNGTLSISASSTGDQFIRLGAGGITSTSTGTIALPGGANRKIILTADQTWFHQPATGSAIISQRRTMEGAFKITKTGTGTIELQANNSGWTGGLQIDAGTIRTSNFSNALGVGTITVNTSNNVAISASGTSQTDQIVQGPVFLGGTGTFSLVGSWNVQFDNTVTLTSDKNVSVTNIGTFNGSIVGSGFRLTKLAGGGTMFLNAANSIAGFNVLAGTLSVGADDQLGAPGASLLLGTSTNAAGTLQTGALLTRSAINSTRDIALDANGGIINTNTFDSTFGAVAGGGGLTKNGAGALTVTHVRAGSLTINGGDVRIASGGGTLGTSVVSDLSVDTAAQARLDLNDHSLIVSAGSLGAIAALISGGLNNGGAFDWQGPGISSTRAFQQNQAAGSFLYGLGVVLNDLAQVGGSGPIYTSFGGQSVSGNEVLVKFTYFGDADLSGTIDATDYSLIDNGYVNSLSGWINGDFDYSGTIDATDYALIDNAYVNQSGPLAEALIAEHTRLLGSEYISALRAIRSGVIPEPAGVGACILAGLIAARGRSRWRSRGR
ncbi:beta strand repeat-containing protein [Fontivita pretiosa]|uniref:beta strand repeat-containing protein n=1 Tax=Fontivita pretiosa TaxID=2989684 RepID=UPI003D1863E6